MKPASDEDLLRAVQSGDTDRLAVLVARWERPLYRFVYRLLPRREEALDVCQETFVRVLDKAHRFREGSRFSTWMYQIALNLCRDRQRRQRRWRLAPIDSPGRPQELVAPATGNPEQTAERHETGAKVRQALESLPPEQREVLVLKEFEGLKFREIAVLLDCPESTVKSRMYYGLDNLRGELLRRGVKGS